MKGALECILRHTVKHHYRGSELPINGKQEKMYLERAAKMGRAGLRGRCLVRTVV